MESALLLFLAPTFASLGGIMSALLYVVFFASSLLLIVIVLLQEGKGGGLAAFGGAGTEAFGVKTGGVNKLTASLAGIFILTALWIGYLSKADDSVAADIKGPGGIEAPVPGTTPPGSAPGGQPGTPPTQPGQ